MVGLQGNIGEKDITCSLKLGQEKSVLGIKTRFFKNEEKEEVIQDKGNGGII